MRRRKLVQCDFERKGWIVYYIPEGGGGFRKSVVYQNFIYLHKLITYENCTPLDDNSF